MSSRRNATEIMERMGFPPDDNGPYVTALRKVVERQVSEGMMNRSYGSWAPGNHSNEVRAREFLKVDWEMQHAHCHEVKCFDGFISPTFNAQTMRHGTRIRWRYFFPWLGDHWRSFACDLRIWRDRVRGVRNPYRN